MDKLLFFLLHKVGHYYFIQMQLLPWFQKPA